MNVISPPHRARGDTLTIEVALRGHARTVEVRGWRRRARTPAAGVPTLVLIHGVGLSHRSFGRLAHELSEVGEVVGVDLPGYGGLPRPERALTVPELAEVVERLLDEWEIRSFVAVGHSMGAQIALELALRTRDRARGRAEALVLVGPVVDPRRPTLVQQAMGLARDSAAEPPATMLLVLRDYLSCGLSWYLAEAREMVAYRTDVRVRELAIPLLVIRGGNDVIADARWCAALAGSVRGGRAVSIPGSRHVVIHTAALETASAILEFALGR